MVTSPCAFYRQFPPLAIANQYRDRETNQLKREHYRLVLVRCSRYEWIARERSQEVYSAVKSRHPWIPIQTLPFEETILYGYAADFTPHPTYVCLPSGLFKARTGRIVEKTGPQREIISLPGIYFFDGWRVQPSLTVPANVPQTRDVPDRGTPRANTADRKDEPRPPEEEARDILAAAYKNQVENGPNTRRAAIRACKYLKVLVDRHGKVIHEVHMAASTHAAEQKNSSGQAAVPIHRWNTTQNHTDTYLRAATLLNCHTWPLADGQNSHWYGKTCTMGRQDVSPILCWHIC